MLSFLTENAAKVFSVYILALVLTLPGLFSLSISPDNRVFYGNDDANYKLLLEFENVFKPSSTISFVLTGHDPLPSNSRLATSIRWLTDSAISLPAATQVDSLATHPALREAEAEISNLSILDYVCPPKKECISNRRDALTRETILRRYISEDARTTAIVTTLSFDVRTTTAVSHIHEAARQLVSQFSSKFPDIEIRSTGTVPLMQSYMDATFRDLQGVLIAATILVVLMIYLTLGNFRMTILLLALGVSTVSITMGVSGYAGLIVTISTATIPLIIFTIVLAASMHFFVQSIRTFSLEPRLSVREAIARAYESNWQPILLTAITTIGGLLSLGLVDSPPIQDIGYWSAFGVFVGTTITLTVIPIASIGWLQRSPSKFQLFIQKALNSLARRIEGRRDSNIAFLVLFVGSVVGIAQLSIDDDFVRYLGADNNFRVDTEYSARELSSLNQLDLWISTSPSTDVLSKSTLTYIAEVDKYLRNHPHVANVLSIADIINQISLHIGSSPSSTLSDDAIAQLFWAYELSLRAGQSTTDWISADRRDTRTSVLLKDISSAQIRNLESDIAKHTSSIQPKGMETRITGESVPISHLSTQNIPAMVIGISGSLLISSLLLGFFYRSPILGIIAFVATFVPVVCGFGLYGLVVQSIGLAATVIVAVTVGIVIDDAIHLIYRFEDGRRNLELDPPEAAAYAIHRTGAAVITTTLILSCGFLMLTISEFQLNSTFGICTGLILATALLFDLFSLPKLLTSAARFSPTRLGNARVKG